MNRNEAQTSKSAVLALYPKDNTATRLAVQDDAGKEEFAVLAIALSTRMGDEHEYERIALLEDALGAARRASAALNTWVAQSLSEYRGSRTTWDLRGSGDQLATALQELQSVVHGTVARLRELIPEARD